MSTRTLRTTIPGTVLALAAALVLAAAPSQAGEPEMDDPLTIKTRGSTGNGEGQTSGPKLSKKAQRLKTRLGGGKIGARPPSAQSSNNGDRIRARWMAHSNGFANGATASPNLPRVPTFRAPTRRPAPRVVRRVPRLSLQRR